jgi:hypothetical protein
MTSETWTSSSNQLILGVTAHWINNFFSLQSGVLAACIIEGNHSGVSLENHLVEVLRTFELSNKIFCMMANNKSNNGTMASHLSSLIPFNPQICMIGCMAHVINLAA